MRGIQVAAAAVDINDPISMPDGTILVRPSSEKDRGRMTNDTDGVLVGTYAVWLYPTPDASVTIMSRKAMHEMKFLVIYREVQTVRQSGEKTKDAVSFLGGAVVEQFLVGSHSTVLPPQIPGPKGIVGAKGTETHLFMVTQEHGHIGRLHDLL